MDVMRSNELRLMLVMARDLMTGRQSSLDSLRRLRRWLLWNGQEEHARLIKYFEFLGTEAQGELKRALSSGQIESKLWLIDVLSGILPRDRKYGFVVAGGWVGSLTYLLHQLHPDLVKQVTQLDIEPPVNRIAEGWNAPLCKKFRAFDRDAIRYEYDQTAEVIVNTSCEHFTAVEMKHWIWSLPASRVVVLQSNDFFGEPGHVNCFHSAFDFRKTIDLRTLLYIGELELEKYKRFMVIGITRGPL